MVRGYFVARHKNRIRKIVVGVLAELGARQEHDQGVEGNGVRELENGHVRSKVMA